MKNRDLILFKEILKVLDEKCSRKDAESRGMEKEWDICFKIKQALKGKVKK